MRKLNVKLVSLLAIMLLVSIFAAGCGGGGEEATDEGNEEFKVGFVYVGSPGDGGFTYAHDQGRKYLEEQVPGVKCEVIENVADADAAQALTQLAESGCKIIFSTSFGFMDPTIEVAEKYPDIVFMHCSGYRTAENVGTYFGRMYQARYLSGIVAGEMTESNLIGYVAAYPIPEVIRGIDAFTLGVRSVNPDATVKVVWTHTWFDPAAEKEAANALLDEGADIIAQHQDTSGPQKAAEEAGKYSIGYNSDMSPLAPKAVLTSSVWNWGEYYVNAVKSVQEGTWESGRYWGSMAEGIVGLAPYSDVVPDEVKAKVEEAKEKILSGEWDVFTGPIKDQDGNVKVAEGAKLTDEEIENINWFVEGVQGTITE